MKSNTLAPEMLDKMDAYWRAANYLSVGQIYLYDNPLLKRPLALTDVKHMLLGHWGTAPGINFVHAHLNKLILEKNANVMLVTGPGHGAAVAGRRRRPETGQPLRRDAVVSRLRERERGDDQAAARCRRRSEFS